MSNAMGLQIPTPSLTPGPEYATDISADLNTIANHTHTGSSNLDGYQVPAAGLNINTDLSFQSNNATSLRSTRFSNQSTFLTGIGDIGCVYEITGDLWYNNGAGVPVQITSGTSLIAPVSGYTTATTSINLTINPVATTVLVACNTTSNAITVTLPLANSVAAGRFYIIKDAHGTAATNNVIIAPNGSNTIDLSTNIQVIRSNFGALCVVSDGSTNWLLFKYLDVSTPVASSTASIFVPTLFEDITYILDVTSNTVTVNLPALSTIAKGIRVYVKDSGAANVNLNVIVITPNGTDKIEGLNISKKIVTAFGEVCLVSTTTGWFLL